MNLPNDPMIRELLPEFVDAWINDIDEQFKPLMDAKNSGELYRFGHTIKGSCLQFGLDEIATLGIQLMELSKVQDWDNAIIIEQKIRDSFIDVKKFLES